MYSYRSLHREMHERMPYSDAVATAHETFMTWMRGLVHQVVDASTVDLDRDVVADLVLAVFEGSNTGSVSRPAHEMIPLALESILRSRPRRRRVAPPVPASPTEATA